MNTAPLEELDTRICRVAKIIGEAPERTARQIFKRQLDILETDGGLRRYMERLIWASPEAKEAAFERLRIFERSRFEPSRDYLIIRLLEHAGMLSRLYAGEMEKDRCKEAVDEEADFQKKCAGAIDRLREIVSPNYSSR